MDPPEILETERLRLRRLTRADAEAIFEGWAQDATVTRYLVWSPHESLAESVAHAMRCEAAWKEGTEFTWMIDELDSGLSVGSIAAHVHGHRLALGYLLASPYWGRGYMTEAVRLLTEMFLGMDHVCRIWAVCDAENTASARVLERAGFEREGLLRRWIRHPNVSDEPRDVICFARVSS